MKNSTESKESMCVVGIIAECNPFHEGHAYLIQEAKKHCDTPYAVMVMNGDFVQRGEPAVFDKYTRTLAALEGGADLVFELPVRFGVSSAGDFARGGVMALDSLGFVTDLFFGSECGSLEPLEDIACQLLHESKEFQKALEESLRTGLSYPHARAAALGHNPLLKQPNNILGIEYCLALKKSHSSLRPHTIRRRGMGYHDQIPESEPLHGAKQRDPGCIPSASSLRSKLIHSKTPHLVLDDFSAALGHALLFCDNLCRYKDISPELASRIRRQISDYTTITDLADRCKTRAFTEGRIRRGLLQCLLGITGTSDTMPYLRLLGMKKRASHLLADADTGSCTILTRLAQDCRQLPEESRSLLQQDITASDLYRQTWCRKYGVKLQNEFQHSPIIL